MAAPSSTPEYARRLRKRSKVCHICHINALQVREMPTCVDCGLRVCPDHSTVAYPDMKTQGRKPRICNTCRQRNCTALLTCHA